MYTAVSKYVNNPAVLSGLTSIHAGVNFNSTLALAIGLGLVIVYVLLHKD